jgi:hypothetical protein
MTYKFRIGLGGAYYSAHTGETFERNLTAHEREILCDMMDGLGTPYYYKSRQRREEYEADALRRMRSLGIAEQHTLRESLK